VELSGAEKRFNRMYREPFFERPNAKNKQEREVDRDGQLNTQHLQRKSASEDGPLYQGANTSRKLREDSHALKHNII